MEISYEASLRSIIQSLRYDGAVSEIGLANPNAGRMTANPRHGSHLVSLCGLCMFSRMRCMKKWKNWVFCIFSVFLCFPSLLLGILVFFLHHNFFSFPCFIHLFLNLFWPSVVIIFSWNQFFFCSHGFLFALRGFPFCKGSLFLFLLSQRCFFFPFLVLFFIYFGHR